MPESTDPSGTPSPIEQFERYRSVAEGLVLRGMENESCELKRARSIGKSDPAGRLEFVKRAQAIAKSHAKTERFIIIGADQQNKCFCDVENAEYFDTADLAKTFSKYMEPAPRFVSYNNMIASTGERFVLIVFEAVQPRPIMMHTEGTSSKPHFRPGDIWIRDKTDTRPATKTDLDQMYEPRIDQEASRRARLAFDHLRDQLGPSVLSQAVLATPVPELLIGGRARLQRFAEAKIARNQRTRFTMLLEMARETLIEKWVTLMNDKESGAADSDEEEALLTFYNDEYRPTLESTVDLGNDLIKYDGKCAWFASVSSLLIEAFVTTAGFVHHWYRGQRTENALPIHQPAFDVYIGIRVLATYAVARQRYRFLQAILPRLVQPLSSQRKSPVLQPIAFWPFERGVDLPEAAISGRNPMLWANGVQSSWGELFRSEEHFLTAAAQLELLLEFDSHALMQHNIPLVRDFARAHGERLYVYAPDFWNQSLSPAAPMAEYLFASLMDDPGAMAKLAVEPRLARELFTGMTADQRLLYFGEFLDRLCRWQDNAMMQQRRSSFYFSWPPHIQNAVDAYRRSQGL